MSQDLRPKHRTVLNERVMPPVSPAGQHTPGPWYVSEGSHWLYVVSEGAQRDEYGDLPVICGTRWTGTVTEQERADARLIAAAPELLASLDRMLAWIDTLPNVNEMARPAIDAARAAVARAKGRP
jgi:hypothetical protein